MRRSFYTASKYSPTWFYVTPQGVETFDTPPTENQRHWCTLGVLAYWMESHGSDLACTARGLKWANEQEAKPDGHRAPLGTWIHSAKAVGVHYDLKARELRVRPIWKLAYGIFQDSGEQLWLASLVAGKLKDRSIEAYHRSEAESEEEIEALRSVALMHEVEKVLCCAL